MSNQGLVLYCLTVSQARRRKTQTLREVSREGSGVGRESLPGAEDGVVAAEDDVIEEDVEEAGKGSKSCYGMSITMIFEMW